MAQQPPDQWVLDALSGVELDLMAGTVPFDQEGVLEWQVTGSVFLEPQHATAVAGAASSVTAPHADPELARVPVFVMRGLTLSMMDVGALDVLDEHSVDAAAMSLLFDPDGEFSEAVEQALGGPVGAYSFVLIDRVSLVPAWRGFGIGRILTDKAIRMLTEPPISLVGVHSHPFEDWDEEHPDPAPEAIARTDHPWESLGFVRVTGQLFVRDESLVHPYADDRAIALGLSDRRRA